MRELEIPEAAVALADQQGGDAYLILRNAGPIIVAAALRRLAEVYERRADVVLLSLDSPGAERRAALLESADLARTVADELHPEGRTR